MRKSFKTDKDYEYLQKDWNKISGNITQEIIDDIKGNQIPFLTRLKTGLNTSAITIVDIATNRFLYVDKDIQKVTGCSYDSYFNRGMRYIFSKAAFAHIAGLVSSTLHQRKFFSRLPADHYNDYIVNREFSYTNSDKSKNWVLHQVLHHFTDENKNIVALAILQTRINHLKENNRFKYYIYHRKSNAIVYPTSNKNKLSREANLTETEILILNLMLKGLTSKEIADQLHNSFHTIRTHRKNIMKKTNCRNIVELTRYAFEKELVH